MLRRICREARHVEHSAGRLRVDACDGVLR